MICAVDVTANKKENKIQDKMSKFLKLFIKMKDQHQTHIKLNGFTENILV